MVVLSRLHFVNKLSHLRKVCRSWTSSCSMSLQTKAEVKKTLVADRGSVGSSGSVDFPSALWRVSVSRLFLYPRTLPPPPPRVPARRFLGAPFDTDSPIKVIKPRVPGSSSPGTCGVLGPPPPPPRCRSRVFLLLLRHDSTAFGAAAAGRTRYAQSIEAGPVRKLLRDWNTNWSSLLPWRKTKHATYDSSPHDCFCLNCIVFSSQLWRFLAFVCGVKKLKISDLLWVAVSRNFKGNFYFIYILLRSSICSNTFTAIIGRVSQRETI